MSAVLVQLASRRGQHLVAVRPGRTPPLRDSVGSLLTILGALLVGMGALAVASVVLWVLERLEG
jgi:hypothetical protein